MSVSTKIAAVCLVLIDLLFGVSRVNGQQRTVSIVIDGDRVILSDGRKIALLGIDAPEKHPSLKLSRDVLLTGKDEKAIVFQGKLAADHLTVLAGGLPVRLTQLGKHNADGYQPALVYVIDQEGKALYQLNQKMIEDGFAVADYSEDEQIGRQYGVLQSLAWRKKRGLWATQEIFVSPQAIESERSEPAILVGNCARDPACIWVTAGGAVNGPGVWRSRPGRKCSCSKNE